MLLKSVNELFVSFPPATEELGALKQPHSLNFHMEALCFLEEDWILFKKKERLAMQIMQKS